MLVAVTNTLQCNWLQNLVYRSVFILNYSLKLLELSVYTKFNLAVCDTQEWEAYTRASQFPCILTILEGSGYYRIHDQKYAYAKNSLFLLPPESIQSFEVAERTKIFVIGYGLANDVRLNKTKAGHSMYNDLLININAVFASTSIKQGVPVTDVMDRESVYQLMQQIVKEMEVRSTSYKLIVECSLMLMINILVRYFLKNNAIKPETENSEMKSVISYIHQYIDEKEKLKPEQISKNTGIQEARISRDFFTYTGYSLKSYIIKYQTDRFKSRLLNLEVK